MSIFSVLGEIPITELGVTLTHEHLSIHFNQFNIKPPQHLAEYLNQNITLQNVGFVKQYPYSCPENLDFFGPKVEEAVEKDLKLYKKFGGGTLLENTTHGLHRDTAILVKLSKATGVNIIAGTGHYVDGVQPSDVRNQTVEDLYNTMKTEMEVGCIDCPTVKCGFIGEVGSSWPIQEFEKRCIIATGQLQAELGCGVSFHPGRNVKAPEEILRIFTEAGGDINKAVMSHLDRTLVTDEQLLEFATLGSFCQFDLFGTECSYYQFHTERDMLSDAQRINKIQCLVSNGYSNKALMSHDIHTRHRLINFGGHGYSHILNNVAPKLAWKIGQETVDNIMIQNPKSWLSRTK